MTSPAGSRLQPTLWRTCRVLANRRRLIMLRLLLCEPGLSVSTVADRLRLPLAVTSQYLRALNARGFLTPTRVGGRVYYRPAGADATALALDLGAALRSTLTRGPDAPARIFRLATTFTHPRRILIYRTLRGGPCTLEALRRATRVSRFALARHLVKLEARGFVTNHAGRYRARVPRQAFGRMLARWAGS